MARAAQFCSAAFVLMLSIVIPQAAQGGHGYGGGARSVGGGFNWSGAVNRAMQMRSQGHHYRQPQGHYFRQPQANFRQGHHYHQPQQYYTPPRTNYVQPQTYIPKVQVVPQVNRVPQVKAPVKTPVRTNVVPQPVAKVAPPAPVKPRVNVVPQPVARTTAPPPPARNMLPNPPATTVARSPQPTPPTASPARRPQRPAPANPGLQSLVGTPTQADLDRMMDQIGDRDLQLIDRISDLIDAIEDLNNQQQILDALDDIRDALAADDFGGDDLALLIVTIQDTGLPPAALQPLLDLLTQIAIDQQVIDWIDNTDPGFIDVPFGPDVPLVLLPGIPDGLLIPLADGPVMIGMGAPGDEILLGTGNPFEVAGLPIPEEGAEPAAEVAAPFDAGQIIVANNDLATVNFNLNEQPQQLAPQFEQTLPGTTTWTIEFDRGNGFGLARYQLAEGYYYFKSTERGWELYKKTFRVKLDNADNTFPFNYVVDDQPQTINPGESHDLTGIFPVVVRFDNGSGEELQRRLDGGPYKVAITEEMTMDIFKAEDVISPSAAQTVEAAVAAAPASAARSAANLSAAATPPAPQAVGTVASMTATKSSVTNKQRLKLPAGFTLFEPLPALTNARTARRLPPAFTLFRSAAEQLPVARTRM